MRYLAFAGDQYYPSGGWRDYRGQFATIEDAIAEVAGKDWWHIVDTAHMNVVRTGGN